jgi:predicted dehydrogenase
LVSYRTGDMHAPKIEEAEALKVETRYFLDCIMEGTKPINDGTAGFRVVRILEAAEQSLNQHKEIMLA